MDHGRTLRNGHGRRRGWRSMPRKRGATMTTPDKLAAFFALLDRRTKEHEKQQAEERKAKEDKKLARLKPWWTLASQ